MQKHQVCISLIGILIVCLFLTGLLSYSIGHKRGMDIVMQYKCDAAYDEGYYAGSTACPECEICPEYDICLIKPTLAQVMNILASYDQGDFNLGHCLDNSSAFYRAMTKCGYVCYPVIINFEGDRWSHALCAFDTADSGLVFVEPDMLEVVDVEPGKDYMRYICSSESCQVVQWKIERITVFK